MIKTCCTFRKRYGQYKRSRKGEERKTAIKSRELRKKEKKIVCKKEKNKMKRMRVKDECKKKIVGNSYKLFKQSKKYFRRLLIN